MNRIFPLACLVSTALTIAGCATSKSADALSPTVAGPIPGVAITSPGIMQPGSGTKIAVDQQPLVLVVVNSATSGVRPLSYMFEIAVDASFSNKVFTREGIVPGGNGQTSLRLPDALATGHTYFWHARAEDGANTGPFSSTAAFEVFTPIVIGAPVPISPIGNVRTDTQHPRFSWTNAPRSGPVGTITYIIEVSDTDSFANRTIWTVGEQPGQSGIDSPADLPANKQLLWRVRAVDPTTAGPWSANQVFQTPAPPVVVPPPPPDGPTGPAPNDSIDLNQAAVYNSPGDIARWPVTSTIHSLSMSSSAGLSFEFSTKQSWPDYTPPGWDGALQYTVWAVVNINGKWNTSGFVQMWRGRPSTGGPILSDFAINWAYDGRWGPMAGYQPHVGEQMGFFLSAGNARNEPGVTSLRERSNVVVVALPPNDNGFFPFSLARTMPFLKLR